MQRTGRNICLHLSGGDCSALLMECPKREKSRKRGEGDSGEKIGVLREEEGKCKETKIHLSITSPSIS